MTLRIDLSVKFRALGITFGILSRHWSFAVPPEFVVWQPHPVVHLNERGVKLDVWVE